MADPKFTDKDIERLNKAFEDTNDQVRDFYDKLMDTLDISKQINKQYDNTANAIRKQHNELDVSKKLVEQYNQKIVENRQEFEDIGKQIQANSEKIQGIAMQEIALSEEKKKKEEELDSINRHILKTMGTLGRVSQDLSNNETLRLQLAEKAKKNEEEKTDLAKQILSLEETRRTTGENTAHLDEMIVDLKARQAKKTLEGNRITMKTIAAEMQHGELMQEQTDLVTRLNKQKTHEYIIETKIKQISEDIGKLTEERVALETENFYLDEKQKKLNQEHADLSERISAEEEHQYQILQKISQLTAQLNFWKLIQLGFERFVQLDKAAEDFRKETGFTNTQMETLRKNAEEVNKEFVGMGVSIDKVYKAAKALTDVFGRTTLVSKEVLANVSLLATNLGVAESDSADVLSVFQGLGGATQEVAMNVIKAGAALSERTGVPFAKVMNDVAKASSETTKLLGANPSALMKAAIAARALGTDLNTLANQQKNLLNYTSSINDELEASAMLGKSISFQEARRLAYEGKIEDSAKATLDMVKQAGDFNAMNLYQREALAKAAGMDLKDLSKMLAVDKQREDIMLRGTPEQKAKLALQEKELKALKERNKLDEEDLIAQGEREIRQQKMQGLMTQFNNLMEEVKVLFADILEPIITPLVKILVPVLRVVSAILKMTIIPLFKMVAEPIKVIVEKMQPVVDTLTRWSDGISKVTEKINSAKDGVGFLGKVVLALGAGLLLKLFFGMAGPSALMGMITAPFKAVGAMAKGLISKVTGGGIAGDAAKGAADAAKGTAGAAKATERTPSGSGVKDFLTNLAAGLKKMGDGKVLFGALNLIPASIGLIAMIPGAIGMAAIGFTGKLFEVGAKGLAAGLSALAKPQVLLGTLALLGVGGAFALFGLGAKLVADAFVSISKVIPDAIVPLTMLAMLSPLLYVAAGGIGALTISLGALAVITPALAVGSLAIYLFSRSINKLGDGITNAATGMGLFAKNALSVINPLRQISSLSLGDAAQGMQAVASSLSSFGVGSAVAGIGSFIGNFLGGDPIAKMEKLASMSDKLKASAEAISSIAAATSKFAAVDSFAKSVGVLADSLDKLGDSLGKIKTEELAKLSTITSAATATAATTAPAPTMTTTALEQKLDKLTELLVGGAVRVYLNGKDVSANLAPEAR